MTNQMTSLITFQTLLSTKGKDREEKMAEKIQGRRMLKHLDSQIQTTSIIAVEIEEEEGGEEATREATMETEEGIRERVGGEAIQVEEGSRRDYTMRRDSTRTHREEGITTKITIRINKRTPTSSIKKKGEEAINKIMEVISRTVVVVEVEEDTRREGDKEDRVEEETMEMGAMEVEVVEAIGAMEVMEAKVVDQVDKDIKELTTLQMKRSEKFLILCHQRVLGETFIA
jgi:hypothetical protein